MASLHGREGLRERVGGDELAVLQHVDRRPPLAGEDDGQLADAALADDSQQQDNLFDRAMARILADLTSVNSAARLLPGAERRRLQAPASADTATAAPLHAEDYWLITPNGSEMTKADYLGAIGSRQLMYRAFEPVSEMTVLGDAGVVVLRYRARISYCRRGQGSSSSTRTEG